MLWKTQERGQLGLNQLAIECVQHHICNHANNCSPLESDAQFNSQLWYPPLWSVVLVYLGITFELKGFCGLDLRVKALAKQLYRAIFINCQDMLVAGNQLQLRNQRMILQYQRYHDNKNDELACERITHLHRSTPGLNCSYAILSKIQVK